MNNRHIDRLASLLLWVVMLSSCATSDVIPEEEETDPPVQVPTLKVTPIFASTDSIKEIGLLVDGAEYRCIQHENSWILNENIELSSSNEVVAYFPHAAISNNRLAINTTVQTFALWGKEVASEVNPTIVLPLQNLFSLSTFVVKKNGYDGPGHITNIEIQNIKYKGELDLNTGILYPDSDTGELNIDCDYTFTEVGTSISLPMLPGSGMDSVTVNFVIDDELYTYRFPESSNLPSKETIHTILVQNHERHEFKVGNVQVRDWRVGGFYNGDLLNDRIKEKQ